MGRIVDMATSPSGKDKKAQTPVYFVLASYVTIGVRLGSLRSYAKNELGILGILGILGLRTSA